MKWCPPNYQVQKGNRLPCCPLPTMLGGWVPVPQEEEWFSQSRSSTLWPVPYCRERITRSCQSPAETDNGMTKETGKNDLNSLFLLNIMCLFASLKKMISLPPVVRLNSHTSVSWRVFLNVCACARVSVKLTCACVVRAVAVHFPWRGLIFLRVYCHDDELLSLKFT